MLIINKKLVLRICVFFRHEKQHIKLPWDLEDAKQLGQVLHRYKDKYFYEVLFAVFLVYILYPFHLQNNIQYNNYIICNMQVYHSVVNYVLSWP